MIRNAKRAAKASDALRNAPPCLRDLRQWVCWRFVVRGGRRTKVPMRADGRGKASPTDAATWCTFDEALAAYERDGHAGVGFIFTADDPFAGVDLDRCINDYGEVKLWARTILDELESYCEVSPSGRGVKLFLRGIKPGRRCKTAYEDGVVEIYDQGRFFTITGESVHDPPKAVAERQRSLDALYGRIFGATKKEREPQPESPGNGQLCLEDEEILRLARASRSSVKFEQLYGGDRSGYGSASEADSALVCMLAFYSRDAVQLDRLFRHSGLFRAKWDEGRGEHTYGQRTIANALEVVTEKYMPAGSVRRVSELADEFLSSLGPQSHRRRRYIFFSKPKAEVGVNEVWRHLSDGHVDRVDATIEGREIRKTDGRRAPYQRRLTLLRDAIALGVGRLLERLPEAEDAPVDPALDEQQLAGRLQAWLLEERRFQLDGGTPVTTSFYHWACGVAPGTGWTQCFAAPVFGRINDETGKPEIAVHGAYLTKHVRYETSRRLAADLRAAGLGEPNHVVRVTGARLWRVWILSGQVLDGIATSEVEEA